jgi:magnesium chelatase family protein
VLGKLLSAAIMGVEASLVDVEIDVSGGLPAFAVVGLPDSTVRESRDRVRSAIRHSGFEFPERRITVNLAPADVRKSGASYDLPIALGLLVAVGVLSPDRLEDLLVVGALSLDGRVQAVRGVLPVALLAARHRRRLVLPATNLQEGRIVEDVGLHPATSLAQIVADLNSGVQTAPIAGARTMPRSPAAPLDLVDVRGQHGARRAVEIAAAGRHNLLLVGPPGAGKTLLARRLPGILPPPTFDESLASTAIHSVAGLLEPAAGRLADRPFRAPHHSASDVALIGGGRDPRPGEVSLAHNGVLFLDEIVEFERRALEALREPMEEGVVRIARALRTVQFPSRFLLVGAMNPCACGYAGEFPERCRCTRGDVNRYQDRLSGPLRDRIDLTARVERVPFRILADDAPAEDSATVRERVRRARERQMARYDGDRSSTNADLSGSRLREHGRLDAQSLALVERAMRHLGLTGRGFDRIRRVARTIADLDDSAVIGKPHVAEAIQFRVIH